MNLRNKYGFATFGLGAIFLLTVLSFFYQHNINKTHEQSTSRIQEVASEIEKRFTSNLQNLSKLAQTIALAPVINNELLRSNAIFAKFDPKSRETQINHLNNRWKDAVDENDPFVRPYLDNPVVEYLKKQQQALPGFYGEIFITNRYGTAIAATAKLTTLSHANKYWWVGSYFNGLGRIFFDDRGYDESAQGYVLGVVVPIFDGNEIIGILKSNVNITGPIGAIVENYHDEDGGSLQLVRSGGKVVFQKGLEPLSTEVSKPTVEAMMKWTTHTLHMESPDSIMMEVLIPIEVTKGSDQFGFGGSYESIDHIMGNTGESWFIILRHNMDDLMNVASTTHRQFLTIGLAFLLCMAVGAFILGHKISQPIVTLAQWANDISVKGFRPAPKHGSNDELGQLSSSISHMICRLEQTMTSRDDLTYEVEVRKQAERETSEALIETRRLTEELKGAQAQMLHREKMASIGQLAAGVAHEINNPIGFVASNLASLEKYTSRLQNFNNRLDDLWNEVELGPDFNEKLSALRKEFKIKPILEDMPELIDESRDGVERVSVIVKNLKSFSRTEGHEIKHVCMNDCLDSTLKMILSELKYKANIVTEYGDIPPIECNAGELNQVFMNLLVNAGHAIEEKGEVGIKTWLDDGNVFIRISDTGKGIKEESLTRIFEPFYTTKDPGQGTGLGLSISYDIVQRHNGNISVESTLDEGTTFTIMLPTA